MTSELQSAISFHKGEASPLLELHLKLADLSDDTHCRTVAERLRQTCSAGWEVLQIPSGQSAAPGLPRDPGLYMFVWHPTFLLDMAAGGTHRFMHVLYVGVAGPRGSRGTIRSRFEGEYVKYIDGNPDALWSNAPCDDRVSRLSRYLTLRPLELWYICADEVDGLSGLESRLINILNPPLNRKGRGRLRPAGRSRAFGE